MSVIRLVTGVAYVVTIVWVVQVLVTMRSGSAAVLFGCIVVAGVALNAYLVVATRSGGSVKKNATLPVSLGFVIGAFINLFLIGMATVLVPLGG